MLNGIRLAKGPEKLGMLQQQRGRVFLVPEQGVVLTVDGEPIEGNTVPYAPAGTTVAVEVRF